MEIWNCDPIPGTFDVYKGDACIAGLGIWDGDEPDYEDYGGENDGI